MGNTIEIPLTRGYFAIIDKDDLEFIMRYKWHLNASRKTRYAATYIGNGKVLRMHNYLMNTPEGKIVDHKNHNGLDNTRNNLRICTEAQNRRNRRKSPSKSRYRGVSKKGNSWEVQISHEGKHTYLGCYKTEREAAEAYNIKTKELRGEFYTPNIMPPAAMLSARYGVALK